MDGERSRSVRRLREDEETLDALLSTERASFAVPWSRESFRSALRHPAYDVYGLYDGETLTGFFVLFTLYECSDLQNLCVAPKKRRQGAGRELLRFALRLAEKRGAETVFLEVREHNAAARSLYESEGFAEYGRRKNYYREPVEDAVMMRYDVGEQKR